MKAPAEDYLWWVEITTKLSKGESLPRGVVKEAAYRWATYISDPDHLAPTTAFWATFSTKGNLRGYTDDEIAGLMDGLEATKSLRFDLDKNLPIVDSMGSGGKTWKTFNISTGASLVASAAGAICLKSGGHAMTSNTGSQDVLQSLGINLCAPKELIYECLNQYRIGFTAVRDSYPWSEYFFFHLRPKPYSAVIFNLMTPFRFGIVGINPYDVERKLIGFANPQTEMIARAMAKRDMKWILVPCGFGPNPDILIDEFSVIGKTKVSELRDGRIHTYELNPEDVGLKTHPPESIAQGNSHEENARYLMDVFTGRERGGKRDAILFNAAAMLYLGEVAKDLEEGIGLSAEAIDEGKVVSLIEKVIIKTKGDIEKFRSYL